MIPIPSYLTAERHPLPVVESDPLPVVESDGQWLISIVKWVRLAVKKGIAVQINSQHLVDPGADCWFAVCLEYPGCTKKNGAPDYDIVLTNGDVYYLCRRDLGKSRLFLNKRVRDKIAKAISRYVKDLS
jgi:hypothetical protein